jgi:hypothetical protein
MRLIIAISFIFLVHLFACSGDCVACHPKLIKKDGKMDKDHMILNRCKTCHQDGTKIEMLNDSNATVPKFKIVKVENVKEDSHTECGSDCWQCHDIKKVSNINIPEHKVLKDCIACHIKLDKNLLNMEIVPFSPSINNTLKETIKDNGK